MMRLIALAARTASTPPTTVPGDPLSTVSQDPDQVRQQACKIVATTTQVCTAKPSTPKPPSTVDLSWLSWIIWLVLIAAVVWVLFMIVRSIVNRTPGGRRRRANRATRSATEDEIELDRVAVDHTREPIDWRAEAEAHRRQGRYREALRCRYRALVGDLARRGLIDEIPGRTTGEERSQLQHVQPAAGRPFSDAADLFDGAWYGHADVGAAEDDRFRTLEQRVLTETDERR